jgi:hypothetical protein
MWVNQRKASDFTSGAGGLAAGGALASEQGSQKLQAQKNVDESPLLHHISPAVGGLHGRKSRNRVLGLVAESACTVA